MGADSKSLREQVQDHERKVIERAIAKTGGNVAGAARKLKTPLRTLWNKIEAHEIDAKAIAEQQ